MWKARLVPLVLLALTALPAIARADDAPPAVARAVKPSPELNWYGWQTLLADAAAVGLMFSATELRQPAFTWTGLAVYAAGGPSIHAAHGRVGASIASVVLRLGLPFLGAVIGQTQRPHDEPYGVGGALVGITVGMGAASVVDAVALTHEQVPAARPARSSLSVMPTVTVGKDTIVGATGTF